TTAISSGPGRRRTQGSRDVRAPRPLTGFGPREGTTVPGEQTTHSQPGVARSPAGTIREVTGTSPFAGALRAFGLGDDDLAAWEASGVDDEAFVDWLTDRVARRPSGARARARQVYGAEDVHDFARRAILGALGLGPADHLLEIGCGGGLLLRDARATDARA